jgi:hypothetical protein
MSNPYDAKALAWQLVIDGQGQPILNSEALQPGTSFSITGTLPGAYYVYVVQMKDNTFVSLLYESNMPLRDEVLLPDDGGSLLTDSRSRTRSYVRAIAAPAPVPEDAWPALLRKLFHVHRSGPPCPGNSDTM